MLEEVADLVEVRPGGIAELAAGLLVLGSHVVRGMRGKARRRQRRLEKANGEYLLCLLCLLSRLQQERAGAALRCTF